MAASDHQSILFPFEREVLDNLLHYNMLRIGLTFANRSVLRQSTHSVNYLFPQFAHLSTTIASSVEEYESHISSIEMASEETESISKRKQFKNMVLDPKLLDRLDTLHLGNCCKANIVITISLFDMSFNS